ncbi:MAG: adenylate/guanylate cyclase domain-containing protein [Lachnospiraceae bacterium]|nr:adenylate/guanylate cyclase domain-containing protein [Lachnospiraceae bacterium]
MKRDGENSNKVKKKKKLNLSIIAVAILAGIVVFLITNNNLFKSIDFWASDILHQPGDYDTLNITVVGIDEESVRDKRLGDQSKWKRDIYAQVVEKLHEGDCQPSVIAFDILFDDEKDPETDKLFVDTCEKYGDVIVGDFLEYYEYKEMVSVGVNQKAIEIRPSFPFEALKNVTRQGFTNNDLSDDGFFRELIPGVNYNGEIIESFALTIYKEYCLKQGISYDDSKLYSLYDNHKREVYFTYAHKPFMNKGNHPFSYISIADLLDGTGKLTEPDGIVLVGGYRVGFSDDFFTPASRKQKMYGVDIHANIIEALATGKLQVEANNILLSIIYGLITACLVLFAYLSSIWVGGAAGIILMILDIISSYILYKNGIYLKVVYLIIPVFIIIVVAIVMHYLSARAEKAKINNAFKMYVAPEIVDEMATDGKFELKLGGQTKDIAVLFIDIRGFTTMSEKLSPEEVVSILNEYFDLVTDAIFKNKGTIDKFVGDAAMAVFNSPNDLDDYVYRAVHTGWDILLGTQDLMVKLEEKHHRTIGFGIGVNCGPATVGNIGSEFRMDYTAIGDTVNTSARLEANAAAGQILISQDVLDRVSEWVEVEKVEGIKLKGKSNEFNIYNVTKVIDKPGYLESGISIRKKK